MKHSVQRGNSSPLENGSLFRLISKVVAFLSRGTHLGEQDVTLGTWPGGKLERQLQSSSSRAAGLIFPTSQCLVSSSLLVSKCGISKNPDIYLIMLDNQCKYRIISVQFGKTTSIQQRYDITVGLQWDYSGKWDTHKKCKNYIEYICSVGGI